MNTLKGLAWSKHWHTDTLAALSKLFELMNKDVKVDWDFRDLSDYNRDLFANSLEGYDLLMLKNRHVATICPEEILIPLEKKLEDILSDGCCEDVIGQGYNCYSHSNHQFAMPFTVTSYVSAYRKDLLEGLDQDLPKFWEDVVGFAKKLPSDQRMMLPLNDHNLYNIFRCIIGHFADPSLSYTSGLLKKEEIHMTLELLEQLLEFTGREALNTSMLDLYTHMSSADDISYVPLIIGNANYSKDGYRKNLIDFKDIPRYYDSSGKSMLFSSGIGVVSNSKNEALALKFLELLMSQDVQRHMIVDFDGHSAYEKYWQDKSNNQKTNHFFMNTRNTVAKAVNLSEKHGAKESWKSIGESVWDYLYYRNKSRKAFVDELVISMNDYEKQIIWKI